VTGSVHISNNCDSCHSQQLNKHCIAWKMKYQLFLGSIFTADFLLSFVVLF